MSPAVHFLSAWKKSVRAFTYGPFIQSFQLFICCYWLQNGGQVAIFSVFVFIFYPWRVSFFFYLHVWVECPSGIFSVSFKYFNNFHFNRSGVAALEILKNCVSSCAHAFTHEQQPMFFFKLNMLLLMTNWGSI